MNADQRHDQKRQEAKSDWPQRGTEVTKEGRRVGFKTISVLGFPFVPSVPLCGRSVFVFSARVFHRR
jgi:hypothetical protein